MKIREFHTIMMLVGLFVSTWPHSFAVGQKIGTQYCFKGHTQSPVGDSYTLSTFSLIGDSSFSVVDEYYISKNERAPEKPWKIETVTGYFDVRRDTIQCTVKTPTDQYGRVYFFHIKKGYLILLDENKQALQKWKACSGR